MEGDKDKALKGDITSASSDAIMLRQPVITAIRMLAELRKMKKTLVVDQQHFVQCGEAKVDAVVSLKQLHGVALTGKCLNSAYQKPDEQSAVRNRSLPVVAEDADGEQMYHRPGCHIQLPNLDGLDIDDSGVNELAIVVDNEDDEGVTAVDEEDSTNDVAEVDAAAANVPNSDSQNGHGGVGSHPQRQRQDDSDEDDSDVSDNDDGGNLPAAVDSEADGGDNEVGEQDSGDVSAHHQPSDISSSDAAAGHVAQSGVEKGDSQNGHGGVGSHHQLQRQNDSGEDDSDVSDDDGGNLPAAVDSGADGGDNEVGEQDSGDVSAHHQPSDISSSDAAAGHVAQSGVEKGDSQNGHDNRDEAQAPVKRKKRRKDQQKRGTDHHKLRALGDTRDVEMGSDEESEEDSSDEEEVVAKRQQRNAADQRGIMDELRQAIGIKKNKLMRYLAHDYDDDNDHSWTKCSEGVVITEQCDQYGTAVLSVRDNCVLPIGPRIRRKATETARVTRSGTRRIKCAEGSEHLRVGTATHRFAKTVVEYYTGGRTSPPNVFDYKTKFQRLTTQSLSVRISVIPRPYQDAFIEGLLNFWEEYSAMSDEEFFAALERAIDGGWRGPGHSIETWKKRQKAKAAKK